MAESEIGNFLSLFPQNLMQLSAEEQRVSLVFYQLLVKGKPVALENVATKSGSTVQEINLIIGRWGSEVLWNEDRKIIGFFGLNLNKTAHSLEVDDTMLYTWCAWDALFIPALLDKTVKVRSTCPVTKQEA